MEEDKKQLIAVIYIKIIILGQKDTTNPYTAYAEEEDDDDMRGGGGQRIPCHNQ
jgi:hypothetical protein